MPRQHAIVEEPGAKCGQDVQIGLLKSAPHGSGIVRHPEHQSNVLDVPRLPRGPRVRRSCCLHDECSRKKRYPNDHVMGLRRVEDRDMLGELEGSAPTRDCERCHSALGAVDLEAIGVRVVGGQHVDGCRAGDQCAPSDIPVLPCVGGRLVPNLNQLMDDPGKDSVIRTDVDQDVAVLRAARSVLLTLPRRGSPRPPSGPRPDTIAPSAPPGKAAAGPEARRGFAARCPQIRRTQPTIRPPTR